jgi:hypothetical protein
MFNLSLLFIVLFIDNAISSQICVILTSYNYFDIGSASAI